eukprot:12407972-Alexandrium_andersonii.AAC.1
MLQRTARAPVGRLPPTTARGGRASSGARTSEARFVRWAQPNAGERHRTQEAWRRRERPL